MKVYSRNCSVCNKLIIYEKYKYFWKARKNNSKCRKCFYQSLKGKPFSEERRLKISKANKIALIGNIPWNKGKKMPIFVREKLSKAHTGMKYGEKTRKKHRIHSLKRVKELGIGSAVDKGSIEYFNMLNKKGYNFKPKRFLEIGYESDGYDKIKHMWCEFDTPYHKFPGQRKKDLIRQKNIISYFEKLGNPLKEFIRVKSDKHGNIVEEKCVYKGEI
jgi:hypothetical protein